MILMLNIDNKNKFPIIKYILSRHLQTINENKIYIQQGNQFNLSEKIGKSVIKKLIF